MAMSKYQPPVPDSLHEAIEAFQRMSVPQGPSDADVLARLGVLQGGTARPVSYPSPSTRRGYLIRFLVPAAVAALLVIGLVGLLLLGSTAPIALADVIKAAAKHKLVRYRERQMTDTNDNVGARCDSIVHADLTAPRLHSESRIAYPGGEAVFLSVHDGRRRLTTDSREKTAQLDPAPKGYKSLLCCLEEFERKQGVVQSTDKLGEFRVVKYHLEEAKQTTSLWVDARTKLPLRMEQVFFGPIADSPPRRFVWTDFAWDPELPKGCRSLDELFSTRTPQGYTVHDRTDGKKGNGQAGNEK
jgi:hypothetical protein